MREPKTKDWRAEVWGKADTNIIGKPISRLFEAEFPL
jgi:hypothetical protein